MKKILFYFALVGALITGLRAGPFDNAFAVGFQINGNSTDAYNYVVQPPTTGLGILLSDASLSNNGNTTGTLIVPQLDSARFVLDTLSFPEKLSVDVSDKADATSTTSALAGKASSSHTHSESDVTNLTTDLAGKAASSHSHTQSDVTGLVAALAGKFPTPAGSTSQYVKGDGSLGTYSPGTGTVTSVAISSTTLTVSGNVTGAGTLTVNLPKRTETYSVTTNSSGVASVTFGTAYSAAPNIQPTPTNFSSDNQFTRVTAISTTGFTVIARLRSDVAGLLPSFSNINGATIDVLITEK